MTLAIGGCGSSGTPRQQARSYIKKMHLDTGKVQASVQVVQIDIGSKTTSVDQLAQDAQEAHDLIGSLRDDFAIASGASGSLGDAETEAFMAATDLRDAMSYLVGYTASPNPARLAKFTTSYQNASGEWDDSVKTIWHTARERGAPTI
jgi:hypothetical protein